MTQIQRLQALLGLSGLSAVAAAGMALWPWASGEGGDPLQPLPLLTLVAAASAAGAVAALQRWHRDLRSFARRARKVHEGETVGSADMPLDELHPLADSLGRLGGRLQRSHDVQAQQLEQLRRQAHADALTGIAHRKHFLSRLEPEISVAEGPDTAGLVLIRLPDLQSLNRRIGHSACDDLLKSLAQSLDAYSARVPGCFAGRLNGSDFALWLPAGGVAHDTAQAVIAAQGRLLAALDGQGRYVAAAVEVARPLPLGQALAHADEALARAEAQPGFAIVQVSAGAGTRARGEADWRRGIDQALSAGRVSLGAFPVCDDTGALVHLDCPLRLRFEPEGPAEPAGRWLALALRSRLTPRVDEQAVALALEAIEVDGVPRCVNVAADSLQSVAFLAAMQRLQQIHDAAWQRLWIDLPSRIVASGSSDWVDAVRPWRAAGAKVGLEHAGDRLAVLPASADQVLDYVRVDGRFVAGIADDEQAARYAQGIVAWARALGLAVYAESVVRPADLAAVWRLNFDGATGPALTASGLVPGHASTSPLAQAQAVVAAAAAASATSGAVAAAAAASSTEVTSDLDTPAGAVLDEVVMADDAFELEVEGFQATVRDGDAQAISAV